ncbi:MAG TPA: hypothetical protein PKD54_04515 [Pirellulaceae bacterium]|nr:hypothetical protein [Pirellulaceae bacterium]
MKTLAACGQRFFVDVRQLEAVNNRDTIQKCPLFGGLKGNSHNVTD